MNDILAAALVSWIIAQVIKVACGLLRYCMQDRSRIIWRIIWAGGMPSVHSAVITSAAVTILYAAGVDSSIFGLSTVMCLIVIYDRSRMYSIYSTFQKRYPGFAREIQSDPLLKDLVGHRITEIIAGVIIGAVSGYLMSSVL